MQYLPREDKRGKYLTCDSTIFWGCCSVTILYEVMIELWFPVVRSRYVEHGKLSLDLKYVKNYEVYMSGSSKPILHPKKGQLKKVP